MQCLGVLRLHWFQLLPKHTYILQDKNPIGKDSGKQSSVANKLMDSRKAHYGQMQSSR